VLILTKQPYRREGVVKINLLKELDPRGLYGRLPNDKCFACGKKRGYEFNRNFSCVIGLGLKKVRLLCLQCGEKERWWDYYD